MKPRKFAPMLTSFVGIGSISAVVVAQPVPAEPEPAAPATSAVPPQAASAQTAPLAAPSTDLPTAGSTSPSPAPAGVPVLPPAAPVAAAPLPPRTDVAPVESAPATDAKQEESLLPTRLAIGKIGWLQVGALLQGWYDMRWNSGIPEGTPRGTQATFRMRRAEIKVSGELFHGAAAFLFALDPAATYRYETSRYTVSDGRVTPADADTPSGQTITTYAPPGNTAALKLFWVTLKSPYVEASIGQFKYPISYEGQGSSSELLFPERGISTRYFGDTYDMGLRLEKKFSWLRYQVFMLNGSGQNQTDRNLQKDLAARVELMPFDGIVVGASGVTSLGERATQPTTKDTVEAFGRLNKAGFLLQGELLWGRFGSTASNNERTRAAGRYAILGYTIADRLQPVVRFGYLDTDRTTTSSRNSFALYGPFGVASDEVRSYEAGLNYYLQGNALKLQAAYGYFDFDQVPALQQFTFAAQAAL